MFTPHTIPYRIIVFVFFISLTIFAQEKKSIPHIEIDSLTNILAKESASDTLTVNRINELSRLLLRVSEFDQAIVHAQKSEQLAKKIKYKFGQATAFSILGIANVYKGNYPLALDNFQANLKITEALGDQRDIANSYNYIGIVYLSQGNYPLALEYYFKTLKIFEELDYKKGILNALNNIGIVYKNQKEYSKALEYYLNALKIVENTDDKQSTSMAYNNIGSVYQLQGNYPKALEYLFQALALKQELGNKQEQAGCYNNIGIIYKQQENYPEALKYYFKFLELALEIQDKPSIALANNNIGLVELELNRVDSAQKHIEKALILAKETGNKSLIRDFYYNTTLVDSTLGNYKDAYQNYKQYIVYRDSLINQENEKKSLEISMGYQFDKKAALFQEELKTKQLQRNIAFVGIGVMALLTILVFYLFKLRNKKFKIEKQNLELQRREVEILKENEQFKTRFIANISHEFRTPLTLINGHVEVLKQKGDQQDFSHFNEIEQNGKRLLTLINQLLDLSKMQSGQYKLKYQNGNVLNQASMLVQSFHSYAQQHGISLILEHTESAKTLPERQFNYSSEALAIIITNLISNAIKYTPAGGSVTTEIDYKQDKIFISITDTGIGISPNDIPRIFERFYQVDDPKQRTYAGSGIGLALVKELVNLHQGDIKVESPVEGGCTFTFWIESAQTEDIETTNAIEPNNDLPNSQPTPAATDESENTELPLVLVIEDQSELRSFIVDNLGQQYRYEQASNGKDGIRLAKELLPDLIISDVMMPDANGYEVCETLKNNVATSHIPIILLTAKAEQKDKLTGLQTGADDYLTKPFSLAEIRLRVKNILSFKELLRKKFKGNTMPTAEETPELNTRDRKFVDDVTGLVEQNISNLQFGVNTLADGVCLSVSQLNRKLKTITGKTPAEFIRNIRLEEAVELLKDGESVADTAWAVGFEDSVYFSKVFKKHWGYPPSSVKK
ncbi:tetratricopeptide repeat protein [Myroides pelagicus]|uniref:hybrid sensor histidine kinase/response regulator transcription factor n=1 Tax=Myroides pelagicus TaxID=270914 RepID=UPI002DBFAF5C|nr:tetratricopeptide repeat protein [Myroides pelagicus]MEC4115087.1 tetratricopeptide repeat protein [Myroides pelagicus]